MTVAKEPPEALELRAPPRPVTRLSRRAIVVTVGVASAGLLSSTLWSLRPSTSSKEPAVEVLNVERIQPAEGLAQLPGDYSKVAPVAVPKLGPSLPGDVGEALFRAERALAPAPADGIALRPDPVADALRAERIARQREIDEAAKAGVFFRTARPAVSSGSEKEQTTRGERGQERQDTATDISDHKSDAGRRIDGRSSPNHAEDRSVISPAASPFTLSAGTLIPAALVTGVSSDLPGPVLATVSENVLDTASGRHLLIPQGSKLIGQYEGKTTFGQKRLLVTWSRLILPDGSSIALDRLPAIDVSGRSGLQDEVDSHWAELLGGAAMSTLLAMGSEIATSDRGSGNQSVVVLRQGVADGVDQVGQELVRRGASVPPTITIREGFPLRVMVSRDLVLRPYRALFYTTAR